MKVEADHRVRAGTAVPDLRVAKAAQEAGVAGLAFLRGIPGAIGGALRMNGGAYGRETKDILVEARGVDRAGNVRVYSNADMGFTYRHCGVPDDVIFTEALFQGTPGDPAAIAAEMDEITSKRESTQPVKSRTGGSTFKNPPGHKAWQLIDAAGCRGLIVGDAQVSELHCNFLINRGNATAADIEALGEEVRRRVKDNSGVTLEWEIKRIGVPDRSSGLRRRADIARAWADQLAFRLLLQRVRDPADGAADREQRERAARREAERTAQRHQREVDVRQLAADRVHGVAQRVARRVGRQQRQQGERARIAVAVERMIEAREPVAAAQPLLHHTRGIAEPLDLLEQDFDQARGAAVLRAGQGAQAGRDARRQRGAGRRDDTHRKGGGVQLVIGAQDQRSADQLRGALVLPPGTRDMTMDRRVVGHRSGRHGRHHA